MLRYILCFTGLIAPFYLIKYRERIGDMIGEAEWMKKIGGIYNLIIYCSVFIFFWALAELTGTTEFLFAPLYKALPWFFPAPPPSI